MLKIKESEVLTLTKGNSTSYVLTLPLKTQKFQENILDKRFEIGRKIYNACLCELLNRYKKMKSDLNYKDVLIQEKSKDRNKKLDELQRSYGLSEYSMHEFVKSMQHHFIKNIDAFTAQKIVARVWLTIKRVMFDKAEKVNYKRLGEMDSLEGKSNTQGIKFRDNQIVWIRLVIPVVIKPNDVYAHQALQDKVKYCRIVRKLIRGKVKYYVQLILEGIPPQKYSKETGEIKYPNNDGTVGIDIGTQTIAYASNGEVKLLELAPEVNDIEKEKRILQRKMDRQRRANNPHKYNSDGTIKLNREKWVLSKNYIKTKNELTEIQRKIATIRKQSHEKLANHILSLGNEIKVEKMNFQGLQKRAKKTTVNEKTGKFNKKKRFGKSLANKAPSMLLDIVDRKLRYQGKELIKVDTWIVKASQYNHLTDEYIKKDLSERWNDFDGVKIQRDLYSAYLIMNVEYDIINKSKCFSEWDNFKEKHDIEVVRMRSCNGKLVSSMGI